MWGTFTFTSSVPISAIALRVLTNERGEFLTTTIPVSPITALSGNKMLVVPHWVDGGGWYTQLILINNTDVRISGKLEFFGEGSLRSSAQAVKVLINGTNSSTFNYDIAPRGVTKVVTPKSSDRAEVGSIRITPAANTTAPLGLAIFSFKDNGVTMSEASVPASSTGAPVFRLYVESSGVWGQAGSVRTGVTIANPSQSPVSVQLGVTKLDGTPTNFSTTVQIPAGGHLAKFANELISQLPSPFTGVLRISASSPVVVAGLRTTFNERGDFLISSIPAANESTATTNSISEFPHVVTGGGYSTKLVLISNTSSTTNGKLSFRSRQGVLLAPQSMQSVK
jgi:hypothetical protein